MPFCPAGGSLLRSAPMDTSALDYHLPEERIAQRPCPVRDEARLLVLDRAHRSITEDIFKNILNYLQRRDCLAMNDTRVIRARLRATKPTGGRAEVFLLRETAPREWEALVKPSARVKPGTRVRIGTSVEASIEEVLPEGRRRVVFETDDVLDVLETSGEIPLPPYIRREHPDAADAGDYQTVYARSPGAVAAPTAGLHYTSALLDALRNKGVERAVLTLHVGYGTFRPIHSEQLEDHHVEAEDFYLSEQTAELLNKTRAAGKRVIAVGTTSARVLETQVHEGGYRAGSGATNLYIYPPYRFKGVDALQTNFHLPRSSLLALVCAFAGTDFVLEAYRYAVERGFRFYSYGDTMLIL